MGSRAKDLTKSSEQEKEILDCVRKGNIERVKSLLDEGTPFNYSYYWNCFVCLILDTVSCDLILGGFFPSR